ncbi:hypothetical protein B2D07_16275 [Desulfococcus multivorans]|nr:uncharacterized protein Dmul_32520 [Desulfococcus multivorans]AQV02163.2 hypothetical protein B2D07_16275 [Desulfococcus multivorans]
MQMTKISGPMHTEKCGIKTWRQFARRVRPRGCRLLNRLDRFPKSVLVTGCQRSGTTMLSRVITLSDGMTNYWFGKDDELDAALILAGEVELDAPGRFCFQTTYLNECYREYFEHDCGCRILWVLRNPFSVVYSLMYNWRRWTLDELFKACGAGFLDDRLARRYRRFGPIAISRLMKACLSYNGKVSQLFELKERLDKDAVMVIEYDDLVNDPQRRLPKIYRFIDLDYQDRYCDHIHRKSTGKKNRLSNRERNIVDQLCLPVYEKAKGLLD